MEKIHRAARRPKETDFIIIIKIQNFDI